MELIHKFSGGQSFLRDWSFFAFGKPDGGAVATRSQAALRAATRGRVLRILLVEDHKDTLRSLGNLLTRLGHQVLSAENMTDALRISDAESFDLLLSDIGLPDGSGHELIKRIRQKRHVNAIAVSGFGMEDDIRRSREAGFLDHLTKPINLDQLQEAISQVESQSR